MRASKSDKYTAISTNRYYVFTNKFFSSHTNFIIDVIVNIVDKREFS